MKGLGSLITSSILSHQCNRIKINVYIVLWTSHVALGKEPTGRCRRRKRCEFDPWIGKIPWRRAQQSTPVFLPRESHGQRSLQRVHGVAKSQTRLKQLSLHTCLLPYNKQDHSLLVGYSSVFFFFFLLPYFFEG